MHRIVAFALLVLAPALALGAERASPKEAELMVHKAIEFLNKEGKEKAFAAISDPKGPFTFRDLYVMVFDTAGNCVAHGTNKGRIGKNLIEEKDVDGRLFIKERIEIALKDGKGWQQYRWQNPADKQIEMKIAYFEKVGDLIVVSGAYKP
jgi:cytochrome c